MGEEALGAFLAVGDEADGLALERGSRGAGLPVAGASPAVGSRTRKVMALSSYFLGGSQSTQAPIGRVTAWLLLPSHGGMTAPKPPAGPPAAITSRWSGDSSAG